MQVLFYNFSKRPNSTKRPSTSSMSRDCMLKEPCSVENPVIRLAWSGVSTLPTYAYISKWSRYYFVTDYQYVGSMLEISLRVDPLATYKTQIGSSTQYVVRAASKKNEYLIDNLYPTMTLPGVSYKEQTTPFDPVGTYILGVIGRQGGQVGIAKGLVYYAMTPAQMVNFVDWANSYGAANDIGADFATALGTTIDTFATQLLRVYDYIRTAFWVPLAYTDITSGSAGRLILGPYTAPATVTAYTISTFNKIYDGVNPLCAFYLPDHPQAATYGAWMNAAPYTTHYIDVPYLGEIPVPSDLLTSGDAIKVNADVSMIDGSATFYLVAEKDDLSGDFIISRHHSQLGVTIPISIVKSDVVGVAGSVLGTVGSLLTGDFIGAAAGVGNALSQAIPSPKTLGGLSGYHITNLSAQLVTTCWMIDDTDNTNHGSPLCENTQINTLSGYVQTQGASLELSSTEKERQAVIAQMDAGFYYE